MTLEQRKSADNGNWLGQTCAKLIDSDEERFPIELLPRTSAGPARELQAPPGPRLNWICVSLRQFSQQLQGLSQEWVRPRATVQSTAPPRGNVGPGDPTLRELVAEQVGNVNKVKIVISAVVVHDPGKAQGEPLLSLANADHGGAVLARCPQP